MIKRRFGFYLALIFAKLAYMFLKITKLSSGTSIIGFLVLKICPDFLKFANDYISKKINVTGTNGKTTTSGLINHLIKESDKSVINNSMGANMLNGVVNSVALEINPLKKTEYSVIELDEANVGLVYKKFEADYILVTNLFKDQLDRYGELATTKKFIQDGINLKPDINVLLNADDPLVASIEAKNRIYYGISEVIYKNETEHTETKTGEIFNCNCGKPLCYTKKFYAQQGHYYCECGYKRPNVKYEAKVTLYKDFSVITLNNTEYKVPLIGLFNAYNAIGAISLALELGIKDIEKNLLSFKVAFGRSEVKSLYGHKTLIQLIKNPIGANEVLKTVDVNSNILIAINDNYADGRDVSWLWDTDFSILQKATQEIVVSGIRASDMALRLKYAGVDINKIKVIKDIKTAVDYIGKTAENNITILPSYTVLLKMNKLKELRKCC
ncbi:MAG: MurT ligase domain-containing protein [bacterium]|nr:MurT ligase domain-containing protein [bacterium]